MWILFGSVFFYGYYQFEKERKHANENGGGWNGWIDEQQTKSGTK